MKKFSTILKESKKEYHFRVKFVADVEDQIDKIEKVFQKYDLIDISKPKKTILQNHPLDFVALDNAEIFIVDVVTGLPASSYVVHIELAGRLGLPEKFIVVRGDNDPLEIETDRINAKREIEQKIKSGELERKALLDTTDYYDYEKGDYEPAFGNEFSQKFLDYMAKENAERHENDKVIVDKKLMFDFLENETPDDGGYEYNKDKEIQVRARWTAKVSAKEPITKNINDDGNFDDNKLTVTTRVKSKNNEKDLTVDNDEIRESYANSYRGSRKYEIPAYDFRGRQTSDRRYGGDGDNRMAALMENNEDLILALEEFEPQTGYQTYLIRSIKDCAMDDIACDDLIAELEDTLFPGQEDSFNKIKSLV